MRKVMLAGFLAFAYVLPESAGGAELKQETTEAFNQYVRVTENPRKETHQGAERTNSSLGGGELCSRRDP